VIERRRILVADDDADAAHALADLLKFEGHKADAAIGGGNAARELESGDYDMAFLDASLPGRSDAESFFHLSKRRPGMRSYLMTGYSIGQLLSQTVKSSGARLLHGPIAGPTLLAAVREAGTDGIILATSHGPGAGEAVRDLLAEAEYAVVHVTNAADARIQIEERRVHVLILDLGLRIIDAVGVYETLQAEGQAKPTIIMSGKGEAALDDAVATGIITKPYDPVRLLGQIERLAA